MRVPMIPLDRARPGDRLVVRGVSPQHGPALAAEGIAVGVEVEVESAVPFGGPLVVRVGRARLALAREAAQAVEVEAASEAAR